MGRVPAARAPFTRSTALGTRSRSGAPPWKSARAATSSTSAFRPAAARRAGTEQGGIVRRCSLRLNPAKVAKTGCLGARYRYEKFAGLNCEEEIKSGTVQGARNLGTSDYVCFYAGAVESQNGQADVICRNRANDGISFEAWKK